MNLLRGTKIKKKNKWFCSKFRCTNRKRNTRRREKKKKKRIPQLSFVQKKQKKKKEKEKLNRSIGTSRFVLLMRGGERDKGDKACFQTSILNSRGRGWSAEAFRLVKGLQTRELEK